MNEKPRWLASEDTFCVDGLMFKFDYDPDDACGCPWDEHDGHGVVSEWELRDKKPGERVLSSDHRNKRYYDWQESMRIAYKDGWGVGPDEIDKLREKLGREPTRGEIVERAVELDYNYLRRWCNDEWFFAVVHVQLLELDEENGEYIEVDGYDEYLGGVESDDAYMVEVAFEMAGEIACRYKAEQTERRYWMERDVLTYP